MAQAHEPEGGSPNVRPRGQGRVRSEPEESWIGLVRTQRRIRRRQPRASLKEDRYPTPVSSKTAAGALRQKYEDSARNTPRSSISRPGRRPTARESSHWRCSRSASPRRRWRSRTAITSSFGTSAGTCSSATVLDGARPDATLTRPRRLLRSCTSYAHAPRRRRGEQADRLLRAVDGSRAIRAT